MDRKDLEIMAPAGSFDCLLAAIEGGADSVYFGVGTLNMRSRSAANFAPEDLPEIMRICRSYGVKAYMTLNIIIYEDDIEAMHEALDMALEAGVDAIIASDIAVISYCRKIGLEVHISTQLNVSNIEALRFYAQFAPVVVLARELRLDQVKAIHEEIVREDLRGPDGQPVRIEMFAHGALCMAVSGKCYLSLQTLGSSANRGACMQVCRRGYEVTDLETGQQLVVDNKYIMSPKDLCTVEFLDKIVDAGVRVFKIEGRARSAEYVRRTVSCYRRAADAVADGTFTPEFAAGLKNELGEVFNRGFWDGYYQGARLGEWSSVYGSEATRRKEYLGRVTNWFDRIGVAEVLVESGSVSLGDDILFIGKTTGVLEMKVSDLRVDKKAVQTASKGEPCSIAVPLDSMPVDKVNDAPGMAPGERLHPRRGDRVYLWKVSDPE
ncbi:MAG: U32 family peptidase [Bacteroidales bacterium]|nr:U32 family peptidase [Bacteroidales bacterium]